MSEKLIDEIKERIRQTIVDFFVNRDISYKQKGEDYRSLLLLLLNIDRKWIPPKPRGVVISKELDKSLDSLPESIRELVIRFKKDFEAGSNVNGHLSKNIYSADDYDWLLDQWCVHHLHLCGDEAKNKNDMSKNRSDYYLLFLLNDSIVCFLDVVEHLQGNEFPNFDFIRIIRNNGWQGLIPIIEMPGVSGLQYDSVEKDDIYQSWKSNVNVLIHNIDGQFYGVGKGVTLSGDTMCDIDIVNTFEDCLFCLSLEQHVSVNRVSVMDADYILFLEVDINGETRQYRIQSEHGGNRCLLN